MEMPAFAARYGLAMPEVDFVGVSNGERFTTGSEHRVRVEALSLGADDLAGTLDDGRIHKVDLFLNGVFHDTLSYGERNTTGVGEYYDFNLSTSLTSGEYWMEVVAEDINGLHSRLSWIVLPRNADDNISITSPAIGEALYMDDEVDLNFSFALSEFSGLLSSTQMEKAYLEINGRVPWHGRLGFEGTDLPADESNLTIDDGTGRGVITFEFDSNGSASSTTVEAAEAMSVSGTGTPPVVPIWERPPVSISSRLMETIPSIPSAGRWTVERISMNPGYRFLRLHFLIT